MKKQTTIIIVSALIGFMFCWLVFYVANTAIFKFQQELEKNFMVTVKQGEETLKLSPAQVLTKILELGFSSKASIERIMEKLETE